MPTRRPLLGAMGKHVVFCDGIDDYAMIQQSDTLTISGDMTLTVMVKLHKYYLGTKAWILVHRDTNEEADYVLGVSANKFVFTWYGNGSWHDFYFYTNYPLDEWLIISCVRRGTIAEAYINGSFLTSQDMGSKADTLPNPIAIGRGFSWHDFINMEIAYVLIHKNALSNSDIEDLSKALKNWEQNIPITDGLVLGLTPHSLDCENGIWNDISGNNNNAILYGARCLWI